MNQVKKSYDHVFKVLLVGDSGVGKTCLLLRFTDDAFQSTFVSTIGIDFRIRTVEVEGKTVKLQVWDTAGQDRFRSISTAYYRNAQGVFLVYDITDRRSFERVSLWMKQIEDHASPDVKKMILGNKSDLEEKRKVSKEEGQRLAQEFGTDFFETSAKADANVQEAYMTMLREILKSQKPKGDSDSAYNSMVKDGGRTVKILKQEKDAGSQCC